jgi:preprotein translocase subunit SecD
VEMTPEGAERLGVFTANNIGNAMAIVLDGVVLSAPVIQNRVAESVIITGNFTQAEALALAAQIRSDPLPSAMVVESITMVAP